MNTIHIKKTDKNMTPEIYRILEAISPEEETVIEFEKGMDFFNRYQFDASRRNFKDAMKKSIDENETHYTPNKGYIELKIYGIITRKMRSLYTPTGVHGARNLSLLS